MAQKRYSDEGVLKFLREIDVQLHNALSVMCTCFIRLGFQIGDIIIAARSLGVFLVHRFI